MAKTNLAKAVVKAGYKTVSRHRVSTLLAASSPATAEDLENLDNDSQEQAVLCVTLACRFIKRQPSLNAIAEK